VSFILQNIGLQLASFGKLTQVGPQFNVFAVLGTNNAAPKSFPTMLNNDNLLDLIFPPPEEGSQPAVTGGEPSADDVAATADASIVATMDAQATLDAQFTPEAEDALGEVTGDPNAPTLDPTIAAEETALVATISVEETALAAKVAEDVTPEVPPALEEATPDPNAPTLDPTIAAEETALVATISVEETALAGTAIAEGGPVDNGAAVGGAEEPTPDIIATMQAETGENPIVAETEGSEATASGGQRTRIRITIKDVLVISVAIILMVALRWFVNNTRLGKAMRATAQNRDAAQIMGINVDRIIALTFAIGGGLAGAAGVMTGIYNGTAVFTMGFTAGLRSFTAAVLGGIGNITGAALGGVLIGVLAAFSDQFLSVRWTNAWVFLILVLVLLFRPTGLLGQEGGEKA
jgi:branched-subunit amino acid ABC-type transport system permease component